MKRQELIDRLSPKLASYTILNVDAEWPFGWDLSKDHQKGEYKRPATKQKEYVLTRDRRLAGLLDYVSNSSPDKLRYGLAGMALTIVAGLCEYDLDAPSDEDVKNLLSIAGVTAKEMNSFVSSIQPGYLSCLGSDRIKPAALILYRVLWDAMCESCGITGWSWEDFEAEKAEWCAQAKGEDVPKRKKSKKSQYVQKREQAAFHRLSAVSDYLQDASLLRIDCMRLGYFDMDLDSGEMTGKGNSDVEFVDGQPQFTQEQIEAKRTEVMVAYADFFSRYAFIVCQRMIALQEYVDAKKKTDSEEERIYETGKRLTEREMRKTRKKIDATSSDVVAKKVQSAQNAFLAQNLLLPDSAPINSMHGLAGQSFEQKLRFSTQMLERAKKLLEEGKTDEVEKLLKVNLFASDIPSQFTDIQRRGNENYAALDAYLLAVKDKSLSAINNLARLEAEYMKGGSPGMNADASEIAEWCFVAIMSGDEAYRLNIGKYVYSVLGQMLGIPGLGTDVPALEDDEDWDDFCHPSDNGRLAQAVVKETDCVTYSPDEMAGSKVSLFPIRLNAAIAEYSNCKFNDGLYIRRSIVKAFRKMGYSEKKAREYAIIVATIQKINDDDPFNHDHLFAEWQDREEPQSKENIPEENSEDKRLAAAIKEKEYAERTQKAAERESQKLRHDLADMQRKQTEMQRKLTLLQERMDEEVKKRDDLIELYEKSAQDDGSDGDVEESLFPFHTELHVVLYGGFPVFHKEIEKLLPGIRIVPHASHIDTNTFRSADIIFIQINYTSHANYWNVCDTARNMDIPFYHLNYASAKRCAAVMVNEIQKIEKKKK